LLFSFPWLAATAWLITHRLDCPVGGTIRG
jgi:hypothetical protein